MSERCKKFLFESMVPLELIYKMSNAKFVEVAKAKVMTTEEMCMRSQRPFAVWSDKDDYCFSLILREGNIKIHDEIWATITDPSKMSPFELKRNPGNRIYLGAIDKINIRYDDMLSEYAKPVDPEEKNEPVTVNVVFESFKAPHYTLSVIFDQWECIELTIYRKPE